MRPEKPARGGALRRKRKHRAPREETSAGGVVFRRADGGALFLVIRDSYRNWGFPKGHLKNGEDAGAAALREVGEETGLGALTLLGAVDTIDWHFAWRGRRIHKVCHFFLLETDEARTTPQRAEGITECRWAPYDEAAGLIAYDNARAVLARAQEMLGSEHRGSRVEGLKTGDVRRERLPESPDSRLTSTDARPSTRDARRP